MIIVKEDKNRKKVYEVKIDIERLKEIVTKLDQECYVRLLGERKVFAYTVEEAKRIIKDLKLNEGVDEVETFKILKLETDGLWYHGLPYTAKYEAIYRNSCSLAKDLHFLLNEHNESRYYKECLNRLTRLMGHGNSDYFETFKEKTKEASEQVDAARQNYIKGLMPALKLYGQAQIEEKLNEHYNYDRLKELYNEARECFKYVLIEDTIKYDPPQGEAETAPAEDIFNDKKSQKR